MVERLNILELFGADKNKYHSCIITCYSFDFLFFEQRVLPALRRAGMININIFVDARMYQHQLANLDGNYVSQQSYSITPINLNGAFHPKILMGIGKNNGFLAIGSGNLTNSGLSSNDEVWGAFHTFKTESKALPMFQSTFEYLKNLKEYCYGFNNQKWDWLIKNSQWLSEISKTNVAGISKNNDEDILLLKSFADASIYNQLLENLPKSNLKNITIISPYYNKKGDLITSLLSDLNPETIDIVVDSRFGTVPYQFTTVKNVKYHEWDTVKEDDSMASARLHAKIIQFTYKDETCVLTGSTNATIEAFGTKTTNSRNAETSILIKSNESKNWLEELQIKIPLKGSFDIGNYNKDLLPSNTIDSESFAFNIKYVELDLTELSIYTATIEKLPENSFVVVEKRNDEKSFYSLLGILSSTIIIELKEQDAELGFRVYLANASKERISYYGKIHNNQLIQRTNPDAKSSRFLEILNGTELGNSDLETLLEFANFKENNYIRNANTIVNVLAGKQINEEVKEYNVVSADKFNENENVIEERYQNAASQLTLLEDFLNNMTFREVEEDFTDSLERTAEDSKDDGISGGNSVVEDKTVLSFQEGQRVKTKLHKTLEKIYNAIEEKHKDVLAGLVDKLPSNIKVTTENIQAILVGLHLIFMKLNEKYYEERFKVIVKYNRIEDLVAFEKLKGVNLQRLEEHTGLNSNEVAFSADANILKDIENVISKYKGIELVYWDETSSTNIEHNYFHDNPVFLKRGADLCSKKGFLINTVSKLLLLLANEVEEYEPKEFARFTAFKKRLFYRVLVLFSSLKWSNKEQQLAEVFLLNVFFILMPDDITVAEILKEFQDLKSKANYESSKSDDLIKRVLTSFSKWMVTYKNNKTELIHLIDRSTIGRVIFKSKLGFVIVTSDYKGTLNLKTPLGIFNKDSHEYEVKKVKGGLKAIMYKI
jgi:hypothetical protein